MSYPERNRDNEFWDIVTYNIAYHDHYVREMTRWMLDLTVTIPEEDEVDLDELKEYAHERYGLSEDRFYDTMDVCQELTEKELDHAEA